MGGDEFAFIGFWLVAIGAAKDGQLMEVSLEEGERASCITIICIPDVEELWEVSLELTDQGFESNAVSKHSKRAALGDSNLAVEKEAIA